MSGDSRSVTPAAVRELGLLAISAALLFVLFHWFGNRSSVSMESPSLFLWIGAQWMESGGDFSHGWIMPLISLYVVWLKRQELAAVQPRYSVAGLVFVVLSLALHWAALRAQQPRVSLVALACLLWSIPFFLYGWPAAKLLMFPCGYILLCFTSYVLVAVAFPLRMLASSLSTHVLNGLGIAAQRHGTMIFSTAGGGFNFNVADPCSGLRSLAAMAALAAPFAYLTQKSIVKRWLLFTFSLPLAMVANTLRIVTIAVVAEGFGQERAMTLYHDYSGYIVFVLATLLMIGVSGLLHVNWIERLEKCRRND